MQEYAQVISNVGFPIGVAIFLLIRFEKKLEALSNNTIKLEGSIDNLSKVVEDCAEVHKK